MKNGHYEASDIKPLDKKGLGITQEQIEQGAAKHRGSLGIEPKKK